MSNIDTKMLQRVTKLCAQHYDHELFEYEYDDEDLCNFVQENDQRLYAYMETLNQANYTDFVNVMFELLDYNGRVASGRNQL